MLFWFWLLGKYIWGSLLWLQSHSCTHTSEKNPTIPQIKNDRMTQWQNCTKIYCCIYIVDMSCCVTGFNHQRTRFAVVTSVSIMVNTAILWFYWGLYTMGSSRLQATLDSAVTRIPWLRLSGLPWPQAAAWMRWRRQSSSAWWDRRAHGPWEPQSAGDAPQTASPPEDKSTRCVSWIHHCSEMNSRFIAGLNFTNEDNVRSAVTVWPQKKTEQERRARTWRHVI